VESFHSGGAEVPRTPKQAHFNTHNQSVNNQKKPKNSDDFIFVPHKNRLGKTPQLPLPP
jgi:hypothetical protein